MCSNVKTFMHNSLLSLHPISHVCIEQVYVPYFSSCRTLECDDPYTYPFKGQCLLRSNLTADSASQPFPEGRARFFLTSMWYQHDHATPSREDDAIFLFGETVTNIVEGESNFTSTLNANVRVQSVKTDDVEKDIGSINEEGKADQRRDSPTRMVLKILIEVRNTSLHDVVLLSRSLLNRTSDVVREAGLYMVNVVLSSFEDTPQDTDCPNGTSVISHDKPTLKMDEASTYFLQTQTVFYNLQNVWFRMQLNPKDNLSTPRLLRAAVCGRRQIIRCSGRGYVYINSSFYDVKDMVLKDTGNVLNDTQYVIFDNGTAAVCSVYNTTYAKPRREVTLGKSDVLTGTASLVALSASLCCLIVVLVVYALLPKLRNVPGVIVMSYSGTMLVSHVLNLVALLPSEKWLCMAFACLYHASVLSTFAWKCALAFDLSFMLRLKAVERSSHTSRVVMVHCYSVMGWLVPGLFVLGFWVMDHLEVFRVGYGERYLGACWMTSEAAIIFLVVVPFCVTWVFTVVCFSVSLSLICRSGRLQGKVGG